MNTVCKEHEWVDVELAVTNDCGDSKIIYSTFCKNCGKRKKLWEDVWHEYLKEGKRFITVISFLEWLKENYFAPENKK